MGINHFSETSARELNRAQNDVLLVSANSLVKFRETVDFGRNRFFKAAGLDR